MGDATVGNPRRAQTYQFELFELILFLKLYKQFSVYPFEALRWPCGTRVTLAGRVQVEGLKSHIQTHGIVCVPLSTGLTTATACFSSDVLCLKAQHHRSAV